MEIFDGDTQQLGSVVALLIMLTYLGWHLFIKKS
jgi:hypothetical protein